MSETLDIVRSQPASGRTLAHSIKEEWLITSGNGIKNELHVRKVNI